MDIHLRSDSCNGKHVVFTVFIDGGNSGVLSMDVDQAASFHQIVSLGCATELDSFKSSGEWFKSSSERAEST